MMVMNHTHPFLDGCSTVPPAVQLVERESYSHHHTVADVVYNDVVVIYIVAMSLNN